jgi:hypothetical protein
MRGAMRAACLTPLLPVLRLLLQLLPLLTATATAADSKLS